MPPLECANFLECENRTVCVAPFGSLRSSFWIQPQFFSIIYQKIITIHHAEVFLFFSFFLAKMAWNVIVCETTDVSRENSIFPIFQKTWFQAILAQKKTKKKEKKKKKNTEYDDFYGVRRSCRVREFYSMCTSLAVECDVPCGVRRNYGRGKFRGQNQNSNPKASPNFQGHTS